MCKVCRTMSYVLAVLPEHKSVAWAWLLVAVSRCCCWCVLCVAQ